jgi:hypothetical protein
MADLAAPPVASPASTSPEDAAAQKDRERLRSVANDICNGMQRLLSAFRTYQQGHQVVVDFEGRLFERISQVIESNGALRLDVRPKSLCVGEDEVFKDGSDPLCRRLFTEGVHFINFREGVSREEIGAFMWMWHRVRSGKIPPDHSFATVFWEASLKGIEVGFVDTFVEGADLDPDKDQIENKKKSREQEVVAVVGMMTARSLPGGGAAGEKTVSIPRSSLLALLKLDSISGLTAKDLEQLDQAQRAPPATLAEDDRRALTFEIEAARRDAPRRALCDLWYAAAFAATAERERVLAVARQLIGLLVQEHEYVPLAGALKEIAAAVRADARRAEEFKGWIAAFVEPKTLTAVAAELDDATRAPQALELLRIIPKSEVGGLVAMLGSLKSDEGRTRLVDLLLARQVTGEQLVGKVGNFEEAILPYLIRLKEKMPPDNSNWFVGAMLASTQPGTRRDGVAKIKNTEVAQHRARLLAMIDDPEASVRIPVYRLLAATNEQGALSQMLHRMTAGKADDAEREQLVRAVGRLGGPSAAEALRREFGVAVSLEVKAVCAEMLGNLRDRLAVSALKPQAGAWFGNKRLKQACRQALMQIESAAAIEKSAPEKK